MQSLRRGGGVPADHGRPVPADAVWGFVEIRQGVPFAVRWHDRSALALEVTASQAPASSQNWVGPRLAVLREGKERWVVALQEHPVRRLRIEVRFDRAVALVQGASGDRSDHH